MPYSRNLRSGEAPDELRDRGLDHVEFVENPRHVLRPRSPVKRGLRVLGLTEAERHRVEMGGLDHDKAVRRVEVGERRVSVQ
jgi:hypothetical protein